MPGKIDLTNQVFSKLTVLKAIPGNRKVSRKWECLCTCGNITTVVTDALRSGKTKSCGCLKFESNTAIVTHGQYLNGNPSVEMYTWRNMLKRCDPNNEKYKKDYFERGVIVCDRWLVFENFLADMGTRPSSNHTLDRENNDGIYCKENCRWATPEEQANNTRKNVWLVYEGERKTISQWSRHWGVRANRMHKLLIQNRIL